MRKYLKFYIDGKWVDPVELKTVNTVNPATEEASGTIALGSAADVDRAVKAARKAFASWSNIRSVPVTLPRPSPKKWARRKGSPAAFISGSGRVT